MATRDPIGVQRRWSLLMRDDFTCAYCGARPGNDHLEVDHLIPHSQGGSDHDNNLVTACDRCNQGKGARVAVPRSMCDGTVDAHGWSVWKRWGGWVLSWNPDGEPAGGYDMFTAPGDVGITYEPRDYFIRLQRVHESDWHSHLERKWWLLEDDEIAQRKALSARRAEEHLKSTGRHAYTLAEFLARPQHPVDRLIPSGQRWRDFCDAIDFARTLIRERDRR